MSQGTARVVNEHWERRYIAGLLLQKGLSIQDCERVADELVSRMMEYVQRTEKETREGLLDEINAILERTA